MFALLLFIHVGTLKLCMRHLLIQCISVDKLFSLGMLNDRISSFSYGSDVTNKPSGLSQHHITTNGHKQSGKNLLVMVVLLKYIIPPFNMFLLILSSRNFT